MSRAAIMVEALSAKKTATLVSARIPGAATHGAVRARFPVMSPGRHTGGTRKKTIENAAVC